MRRCDDAGAAVGTRIFIILTLVLQQLREGSSRAWRPREIAGIKRPLPQSTATEFHESPSPFIYFT
jgi:hypothetical protein